ncbi:unnamed protein product [Urochloa humidicola]
MASDSDSDSDSGEDQGHSINDDLRMQGLRGDDESDLEADRQELFGSAAAPIEVEVDGGADGAAVAAAGGSGAAAAAAGEEPTVGTGGKRKRPSTSDAWLDFEKLYTIINGKKVRTGAKCFHCGAVYAARSKIGTGSLRRHVQACQARKKNIRQSQSLLSFSSDGSVRHWEYSAERARTQLCRLICRLDLPLCVGASPAFEEYIREAHNPRFTHVSAQTTARDLIKYNTGLRDKLIASFADVSSVSLTSDIWSGNAKEDYLSVVAHYVNPDWQSTTYLKKNVLIICI